MFSSVSVLKGGGDGGGGWTIKLATNPSMSSAAEVNSSSIAVNTSSHNLLSRRY